MANVTVPMLPQALSLTGVEQLAVVQAGISVRATAAQVAALGSVGPTGVATDNPTGFQANYTIAGAMGADIGFADLNASGACIITGITAGFDGQILTITNLNGSNQITLNALDSTSLPANQFRLPSNVTLVQYQGQTFRYSVTIGCWVAI